MLNRQNRKEVTSYKGIPVYDPGPSLKKDGYKFEIITDARYRFKKEDSLKKFIDTKQKRYHKIHAKLTQANRSSDIAHWQNAISAVREKKDVDEIDSFIEGEARPSVLNAAEKFKAELTGAAEKSKAELTREETEHEEVNS